MMDWDDTKPALIARLSRYNAFQTEAALARFYQAVLNASAEIRRKGEWPWKNQTDTLSTTAGSKGPYAPPSGFLRFALTRKIYRYGFTDPEGVVLAPVRPTESQSWDLLYREEDGMFYFREDPGTHTLTLNFVGEFANAPTEDNARAAVEVMPGDLYQCLGEFVEGEFLRDSPDTRNEGLELLKIADLHLTQIWTDIDKGRSKQRQRSPRGIDGRPFDGLGRSASIHKGPWQIYPRGRIR